MQLGIFRLRFRCLTGYVISTRISGKYISSNFNINVLQKNVFCRFISDQDKNITSFVAWNVQGNFLLSVSANQGNLAESFLKIAVYLTFPYLIPYKILHLYLPEMSVRMTYPSHPRKTRNTPSCTSISLRGRLFFYVSLIYGFGDIHLRRGYRCVLIIVS